MVHFDEIAKINPLKIPFAIEIFRETFKRSLSEHKYDKQLETLAIVNLPYQLVFDNMFDMIDTLEKVDWYNREEVASVNRLLNYIELVDSTINSYTIFTDYRKKMYTVVLTSFFKTFGAKPPMKCHDLLHGYIKPEEV